MLRVILAVMAFASLTTCVLTPVLHFLGTLTVESYKDIFLAASLGWFVLATSWLALRKKRA